MIWTVGLEVWASRFGTAERGTANLKWNSAAICLEAKWPVATPGLRLAISAPSCDSPPPHSSRHRQHTSTATFLDTVPAYAYRLPYTRHLSTVICTSKLLFRYPLLQSLRPQLVGPPAISAFDCSPIAALDLRQIHFATSWAFPSHLRDPAACGSQVLRSYRHQLALTRTRT
jgi:hypothetical protein